LPLRQFLQHTLDNIEAAQDGIDGCRVCAQLFAAQLVEEILEMVGPVDQILGIEKSGAALQGMKSPEQTSKKLFVVGTTLEAENFLLGLLQQLSRLWQIVLQNLGVHGQIPNSARRASTSPWSMSGPAAGMVICAPPSKPISVRVWLIRLSTARSRVMAFFSR